METIEKAGALTPELKKKIEQCVEAQELEDLYLPYRPKRRTKATIARDAGLEPLADKMFDVALADPYAEARKYTSEEREASVMRHIFEDGVCAVLCVTFSVMPEAALSCVAKLSACAFASSLG